MNPLKATRLPSRIFWLLCALSLGAQAAPKTVVAPLPVLALPGASDDLAAKITAAVSSEFKGRADLKMAAVPEPKSDALELSARVRGEAEKAAVAARSNIGKASVLFKKGDHGQAAVALAKAVKGMLSHPLTVDEAGGRTLVEASLQLAVARVLAGEDEGADQALMQHIRWAPERTLDPANFPPAFLRAFEAARARTLGMARGTLRVLAPPGAGETRVLIDGRPLRAAPLQLTEVIPGTHVVRVERVGEAWAETIELAAGVDLIVVPRFTPLAGAAAQIGGTLTRGLVDKAVAKKAGALARSAGAVALLLSAVSKEGDGFTVRSALVFGKGDRVLPLSSMAMDRDMLGASLEVLRLVDDLTAKLASTADGAVLPLSLGNPLTTEELPQVSVAPPPPEGSPGAMAASAANAADAGTLDDTVTKALSGPPTLSTDSPAAGPKAVDPSPKGEPNVQGALAASAAAIVEAAANTATKAQPVVQEMPVESSASRRVAVPGQKPPPKTSEPLAKVVEPSPTPPKPPVEADAPSKSLVIPRRATARADDELAPERAHTAPVASTRIEAYEASQIATVREQPAATVKKSHAAVWIVAGVLVAGGLGVGGYFLYQNSQTPTSATMTASWAK